MNTILFFDADSILKKFLKTHPINNISHICFDTTVNDTSDTVLAKYLDTSVISVFTHSDMISTQKLEKFKNLKCIATRTTGFNHIDLEYCKKRNITVLNVPRYGEITVSEYAIGLLLALSRKIIQGRNGMAHNHIDINQYMGFDLHKKVIGIIGTGSIGKHMIQLAQGFGMNVKAYDINQNPELSHLYVPTLDDIFTQCDIISLHIPSTSENYHLLNERAFKKMKKGVIIINTARGDLIDTQALYNALKQGIVGGAGLDVLENEDFLLHDEILIGKDEVNPDILLDSAMNLKLLQLKNVIATPHIAFNSIDAINRINEISYNNIKLFLENKPQHIVV